MAADIHGCPGLGELIDYVEDGLLGEARAWEIDHHLGLCSACTARVRRLRGAALEFDGAFAAWTARAHGAAHLAAAVNAALAEQAGAHASLRERFERWRAAFRAGAAGAVGVLIGAPGAGGWPPQPAFAGTRGGGAPPGMVSVAAAPGSVEIRVPPGARLVLLVGLTPGARTQLAEAPPAGAAELTVTFSGLPAGRYAVAVEPPAPTDTSPR